jgi:apolipoprotein N-acyltransferase
MLICSEVERPALAARYAAHGADVLVAIANDAQLPGRAAASEIAQSRLRAVETGLPLLRAANLGGTLAIDPYGRVDRAVDGVVELAAPAGRPAPAVRWAGLVEALCALAAGASVIAALRPSRRKRSTASSHSSRRSCPSDATGSPPRPAAASPHEAPGGPARRP